MLESFTSETFAPLVGESFRMDVPGGTLDLLLAEVTLLPPRPTGRQPFTLLFHEPAGRLLPQGMHPVLHPELGLFDLFLVPLGPDPDGMRYEAVFG